MSHSKINKMVLGTAQLGFNYGIANRDGKPSKNESMNILETAWDSGIRHFDTAPSYNSEKILGKFIKAQRLGDEINILTKIPALGNNPDWKSSIHNSITKSLSNLGCNSIKVLFFHDAKDSLLLTKEPKFFLDLLESYPISSLGVSVYDPDEVQRLKECSFDLAFQFPYNILDRRFEDNTLSAGKRYARSIFLQGLLASQRLNDTAPQELQNIHSVIHRFCSENNISLIHQAIQFVAGSKSLDFFLIGVDKLKQLKQILRIDLDGCVYQSSLDCLASSIDDKWLDPRNWN